MSWCDFDPAAFYNSAERKARKEHRCEECRGVIAVGERHQYVSGLWEGRFATFRTCADCVALWCDLSRTVGAECGVIHGGLSEEISNVQDTAQRDRLEAAFDVVADYRKPKPKAPGP